MTIAQKYSTLSEAKRLEVRLKTYVLINPDEVSLDLIKNLKTPIALNLSEKKEYDSSIVDYFKSNDKIIYVSDKEIKLFSRLKRAKIQILPANIDIINFRTSQLLDTIPLRYKGLQELGGFSVETATILNDSLVYNLWRYSGKIPNFIFANKTILQKADEVALKLNSRNKIFGVVRTESELLNHVRFKGNKWIEVNGHFSFPDNGYPFPNLVPLKTGYHFSPDIINITKENSTNLKEFVARPLDGSFKLLYHFIFDPTIKNIVDKENEEIISKGVAIKTDEKHGSVGFFNERAYIDTGLKSKSILKSNFTITAWIKPTALDKNNSILGKGRNFVLKIHEGSLTFTMAGVKDYISIPSSIPINEWTHISLVHSKNTNDLTFYLNGEQTDRVELIEDYVSSDYNLLIGNNLWEEFFVGYLADVKIWERELNGTEILNQFKGQRKNELENWNYTVILIGVLVFFAIILFLLLRRSKKVELVKEPAMGNRMPEKTHLMAGLQKKALSNYEEQILCFGTLKIENKEGENIAKKLSPKLKKIFIIILLHSSGRQKGISTAKLTEFLWPGMSVKSAKNTRGTNIQNLRSILASCSEINLIFKDKFWFLEIGDTCYCDYHESLKYLDFFSDESYTAEELEKELPKLLNLLKEGRLLTSSSDSWLDPFIEKISNRIIKQCLEFSEKLNIEKDSELLYSIAEVMYLYDDLNEKALQMKLQILIQQGKLSLARTVYDNFSKLYLKLYKENYSNSFEDMVSGSYSE